MCMCSFMNHASRLDADRGDGQSFQFLTQPAACIDSIDGIGWDGLGRQAELDSRETLSRNRTGLSRNSDRVGSIGIFIDGIGEKPIKIHYVPYVTAGARCLATTGS